MKRVADEVVEGAVAVVAGSLSTDRLFVVDWLARPWEPEH